MIKIGSFENHLRMWCTKCDVNILWRDKPVRAITITDLAQKHEESCPRWYRKVPA